ncbi:conjugal transfer protein [Mycoplasmopsis cynos]|nr:conjugal transfer protein [Mycoplasmopsis cynos]WQQ16805.1 conjugal transfer protein [Mycoplasmopsis cynos]
MRRYLFDEHTIIANKTLAKEIGLNEALILQQINYWIEINKKTGKNFYEGRYWAYNSIRSWRENDFDYMSLDTVKRTFAKLEKQGYLISGNFNKDSRDKTKWYTIDEEKLFELYEKI